MNLIFIRIGFSLLLAGFCVLLIGADQKLLREWPSSEEFGWALCLVLLAVFIAMHVVVVAVAAIAGIVLWKLL